MKLRISAALLLPILALASCSAAPDTTAPATPDQSATSPPSQNSAAEQEFPDVLAVQLRPDSGDEYAATVTISSPYDSPDRYADGWRVLSPNGTVLGSHELGHDHADEQPFARTQVGLVIPADVDEVVFEGHDTTNGYGGQTSTVIVPR